MKLDVNFDNLRFPESVIRNAISAMRNLPDRKDVGHFHALSANKGDEGWDFENVEEFFAEFSQAETATLCFDIPGKDGRECNLWYRLYSAYTSVTVYAKNRDEIHTIMNVFKSARELATPIYVETPPSGQKEGQKEEEQPETDFSVFVGHGHSSAWQTLKNHLQDKHDIDVIAFESGARAGHVTRDILDEMLDQSSLAFLVLTGEDETKEGQLRARQNVIHETGLFQGRLGFSKAIVLLEEGVEELSNLAGIQYIAFPKGRIEVTFGDVVATISRERRRLTGR